MATGYLERQPAPSKPRPLLPWSPVQMDRLSRDHCAAYLRTSNVVPAAEAQPRASKFPRQRTTPMTAVEPANGTTSCSAPPANRPGQIAVEPGSTHAAFKRRIRDLFPKNREERPD